jgi:hypothetical protein
MTQVKLSSNNMHLAVTTIHTHVLQYTIMYEELRLRYAQARYKRYSEACVICCNCNMCSSYLCIISKLCDDLINR